MSKTYAVADLHGQYLLWDKIKHYLQPDDKCYVLGDCIDRGQDGYKILKEVLADDRFIFILGNHEDMMLTYFESLSPLDKRLWFLNGGEVTYKSCKDDLDLHDVLQALALAPKELMYKNIHLSHAGFSPGCEDKDLLWDRVHFYTGWIETPGIDYLVHGHTYGYYIQEALSTFFADDCDFEDYDDVACKYCGGHKFCIDGGTYMTHRIGLFDLDKLEVAEVFTADEDADE